MTRMAPRLHHARDDEEPTARSAAGSAAATEADHRKKRNTGQVTGCQLAIGRDRQGRHLRRVLIGRLSPSRTLTFVDGGWDTRTLHPTRDPSAEGGGADTSSGARSGVRRRGYGHGFSTGPVVGVDEHPCRRSASPPRRLPCPRTAQARSDSVSPGPSLCRSREERSASSPPSSALAIQASETATGKLRRPGDDRALRGALP